MAVADSTAPGDLANWLNTTSGAFNYTGLVENMESRAGSFYGTGSCSASPLLSLRFRVMDVRANGSSWPFYPVGLACNQCQESPGLLGKEYHAGDSCPGSV